MSRSYSWKLHFCKYHFNPSNGPPFSQLTRDKRFDLTTLYLTWSNSQYVYVYLSIWQPVCVWFFFRYDIDDAQVQAFKLIIISRALTLIARFFE
jgi:hypothetical protein